MRMKDKIAKAQTYVDYGADAFPRGSFAHDHGFKDDGLESEVAWDECREAYLELVECSGIHTRYVLNLCRKATRHYVD